MQTRKRISLTIVNVSNEFVCFDNNARLSLSMIINSNSEINYVSVKLINSIVKLKRRIVIESIWSSCIDKSSMLSKNTSLIEFMFQLIVSWFMFIELRTRCINIFRIAFFLFRHCRSNVVRNRSFVVICNDKLSTWIKRI
jgi:hypothetical protein